MHCVCARPAYWVLCAIAVCAGMTSTLGAKDRFTAWLASGEKITASRLPHWPIAGGSLKLEGRELLGGDNPLRLLKDLQAVVDSQPPYLVLANGDVLSGSPTRLESDQGRLSSIPRVHVQLERLLPVSGTGAIVRTDRVARIVASAEAARRKEPPPGTVELADGRRLLARSIRWRDYGLSMLTPEGVVEANYAEIVDAVFPGIDRMAAVLDDNHVAASATDGTIVRLHLTSGAILTTSRMSREVERTRRRASVESNYYYYCQPAWADQPIAVPEREIGWCSCRAPNEVPLALLDPQLITERQLVAGHTAASSPGELAASGAFEADLSLRTRSYSELSIDLPLGATRLLSAAGLDRAVGNGGCVRCRIVGFSSRPAPESGSLQNDPRNDSAAGRVLWDSDILQGADGPKPTGELDVSGLQRVVLITDFAHEGRPAGADPLDIRDNVVWLAPLVQIEKQQNTAEQLQSVLAGLESWQLSGEGWGQMQLANRWNWNAESWDTVLTLPQSGVLTLERTWHVNHTSDIVELRTACPPDMDQHVFSLDVGDSHVGWNTSTDRDVLRNWVARYYQRSRQIYDKDDDSHLSDRLAYWWDLQAWRGQEVTVRLTLRGDARKNEIVWRGFGIRSAVSNLPPDGRPLACDVPLTALAPLSSEASGARLLPMKNGVPGSRDAIRFLGQTFTGGYGMRENTSIAFPLAPEYRRFVAIVGCCHLGIGPVQLKIDDEVVWQQPMLRGLSPAEQIDIEIPAGSKTLTLLAGPKGPYNGQLGWTHAGFVTSGAP
jgi:hypothetical protein